MDIGEIKKWWWKHRFLSFLRGQKSGVFFQDSLKKKLLFLWYLGKSIMIFLDYIYLSMS